MKSSLTATELILINHKHTPDPRLRRLKNFQRVVIPEGAPNVRIDKSPDGVITVTRVPDNAAD